MGVIWAKLAMELCQLGDYFPFCPYKGSNNKVGIQYNNYCIVKRSKLVNGAKMGSFHGLLLTKGWKCDFLAAGFYVKSSMENYYGSSGAPQFVTRFNK